MSDHQLSLAQSTLKHRLEDIPPSIQMHIRMGLSLLLRLTDEERDRITSYVINNFARRSSYDLDEASRISSIERSLVGDLLSTITIVVGSAFDLDVSKDDFFAFADESFRNEGRAVTEAILTQAFDRKAELKKDVEAAKLANEVLPSFRNINCAVDVRLRFDDSDSVVNKVPVAVIYIATDSKRQELWMQAAESDLDALIDQLTKVRNRVQLSKSFGEA